MSRPVNSTRPDQQSETMSRQETTTKEKANKKQELRNVGATSQKTTKKQKAKREQIERYHPIQAPNFFDSGNAPGGAFCLIFVLKNAPGTLQTPRGRYFRIVLWSAPGGVHSVLYGNTSGEDLCFNSINSSSR